MRYRILGPLEVLDDAGGVVSLGGRRERILLTTLLVEANRVVSSDRLIDAVWGERPPETATNALQVQVSRLRKALVVSAGTESSLHTQAPGYVLRTSPGELDSDRFEALAETSHLDEGPAEVSARLAEALALWRGSVLEGIETDAIGHGYITRLEELRISVLERRIEADLALGRHGELIGELEALIHAEPLREGLRAQLMLALYRSGRQADALGVYRRTRQILKKELGIVPNPALQNLELAILNQAPELDLLVQIEGGTTLRTGGGVTGSSAGIPLPTRLAVPPAVGVLGREPELRLIADAYKRVVGGEGREVLLVSGEAGLGKTTLVSEATRLAFDDGACVLFGHCEEDLATPYSFFAEALSHFVSHATDDQLLAHVGVHGSELSRLVPNLLSRIPDLPPSKATDPDTERYLLFAAAVGLLAFVAHSQPVVLVLDDLQWADKGSLLLLRHLAAAEQIEHMLVLATYRDSELAHADALRETLGVLHRHGRVNRIELAGLDDQAVLAFLEAAAGRTLDDTGVGLAHAVYRETDGNPFFVSEVLRHLSETGAISQDTTGRWLAQDSLDHLILPDSVREVVGGRVARLGRQAERALSLAAVIGRDFDLDVLSRASKTSQQELLDILDAAIGVALVRELNDTPGHYNFAHALIQHTLYQDLGPTRRAHAHRQVAEALEEILGNQPGTRVGELAHHWVSAIQPIDLAKAIGYSRQAGDAALSALAPGDALRYYTQALELYPESAKSDPDLEVDLLIGIGTAQRQTGDPTFRDTLLRASRKAAELNDTERLVTAALANDRGTFSTVSAIDHDKVEMLETALDRLPARHADRALVLAALCSELTIGSPLDRRQALADEALSIAESHGEDATVIRVLNHIQLPLAVPHLLDLLLSRSTDALIRAQRVGDPVLLCSAASGRRYAAACAGDVEEMDRCLAIKQPLVEQLGQPFLNWVHALQTASRAIIAGDSDTAELLAAAALQIGTDGGEPDAFIAYGAQIIMVHLFRGTLSTLVPMIEQATSDNPGLPVFAGALALAHAESENVEETRRLLDAFAAMHFDLPLDVAWLTGMIAYADAAIECQDPRFAAPVFERLAPFAGQWLYTDIATSGPVSRSLGDLAAVLGRFEEADLYFSESAASSERAGAKFFAARTNLSWGMMLAARCAPGDTERARHRLTQAQSAASENGYRNVERRATTALEGSLA